MQNIIRLAQKFQVVLLFLFLQAICFLLLISGSNSYHRSSIASSSNAVTGQIYTWTNDFTSYFNLRKESDQLIEEHAYLKEMIYGHQIEVGKNFVTVDDTIYYQQYQFIPAKVIKSTKSSRHNYLTINSGKENSIFENYGIIGTKGVVGITVASSQSFSTVKPIINESFTLAVRHKNSKNFGKLIWEEDDNYMTATVLDVPSNVAVDIGDVIETRGSDGLFPEGVPVGKVLSTEPIAGETYQIIKIGLVEDYASIYNVNVIKNVKKIEQLKLEEETMEDVEP